MLRSPGAEAHNGAYVASRDAIGEKNRTDEATEAEALEAPPGAVPRPVPLLSLRQRARGQARQRWPHFFGQ